MKLPMLFWLKTKVFSRLDYDLPGQYKSLSCWFIHNSGMCDSLNLILVTERVEAIFFPEDMF